MVHFHNAFLVCINCLCFISAKVTGIDQVLDCKCDFVTVWNFELLVFASIYIYRWSFKEIGKTILVICIYGYANTVYGWFYWVITLFCWIFNGKKGCLWWVKRSGWICGLLLLPQSRMMGVGIHAFANCWLDIYLHRNVNR